MMPLFSILTRKQNELSEFFYRNIDMFSQKTAFLRVSNWGLSKVDAMPLCHAAKGTFLNGSFTHKMMFVRCD
jgi:hypothetical protein